MQDLLLPRGFGLDLRHSTGRHAFVTRRALAGSTTFLVLSAFVFVVFVAAGVALLATRFIVPFIAATLTAIFTVVLTAGIPDRVGEHLENFHRRHRVVALDDELTAPWTPFGRPVLNDN